MIRVVALVLIVLAAPAQARHMTEGAPMCQHSRDANGTIVSQCRDAQGRMYVCYTSRDGVQQCGYVGQ